MRPGRGETKGRMRPGGTRDQGGGDQGEDTKGRNPGELETGGNQRMRRERRPGGKQGEETRVRLPLNFKSQCHFQYDITKNLITFKGYSLIHNNVIINLHSMRLILIMYSIELCYLLICDRFYIVHDYNR